jgi:protoheme IX farnesyltransferase
LVLENTNQTYQVIKTYSTLENYSMLVKFKLSITVVLTSVLGYLVASDGYIYWSHLAILTIGGFLVAGAANAINEVLEKDYDALMVRTSNRPLATGRMKVSEAVLFAGISCMIGIGLLATFNPITALLGMLSFVIYAFIYTPLKRFSTSAVAVGAIPGALPVLIGCTAAEGKLSILAISLFMIQFLWQFPHFWAIGFLSFDEYQKAGYKLLPTIDGALDKKISLHSVLHILLMIPSVIALFYINTVTLSGLIMMSVMIGMYAYYAMRFYKNFEKNSARTLMFASFFFMPIILLICLFF